MSVIDVPGTKQNLGLKEIANYTFTSKYARYREEDGRRETWDEAVARVEDMHLRRFTDRLSDADLAQVRWAFDMVRDKKVVPSMRAMQFGGLPIEANNLRSFNCSVTHVDKVRSFAESFYLLLSGCGVGFGLSRKQVSKLPHLVSADDRTGIVQTYVIEDSIEGWSDSIEALLNCYFKSTAYTGRKIVFDYSRIRPAGSPLKTSGGKAPGHEGLKAAHIKIKGLLDRIIENEGVTAMRPIHAYDILMHVADAVLSGGVRRSACIALFDRDDMEMLNAKVGSWFEENPQRGRSNNSMLLKRGSFSREELDAIIQTTREWGEPGFVFVDDLDTLYNPCLEIGFKPTFNGVNAVQVCNLTEINGAKVESYHDFVEASKAAAIIGTLQADFTSFPYLSHEAEEMAREDALLGVSITAMMDSPEILFDPDNQRLAASAAVATNEEWAKKIGINPAARVTCVKPAGTSTIVLESMASGIHPAHSRKFFRRVQANRMDNVFQYFSQWNPHAIEKSVWSANDTDDVITFPIELSGDVMVKSDLSALEHLAMIRSTQENWVATGFRRGVASHNVSCTIIVKDAEWDQVVDFLFDHQDTFTGVSLISDGGDKSYQQAPMESVATEADEEKFSRLSSLWTSVNYSLMSEVDDNTSHAQEAACAGGACAL